MTQSIPLTKGKVALVSDEDYSYLLGIGSWCFSNVGYAVHFERDDDGCRRTRSMHRLIMARVLGHPVPTNLVVDHIDRNRLNNTRANLRTATRSQNQANRSLNADSVTRYKGVTPEGYKFRVRVRFNRHQRLHLGSYDDATFGAHLYDAAALLLHGDFAATNFPGAPVLPEVQALVDRYIAQNPDAVAYLTNRGGPPHKRSGPSLK
jgi:hypothetical protein